MGERKIQGEHRLPVSQLPAYHALPCSSLVAWRAESFHYPFHSRMLSLMMVLSVALLSQFFSLLLSLGGNCNDISSCLLFPLRRRLLLLVIIGTCFPITLLLSLSLFVCLVCTSIKPIRTFHRRLCLHINKMTSLAGKGRLCSFLTIDCTLLDCLFLS